MNEASQYVLLSCYKQDMNIVSDITKSVPRSQLLQGKKKNFTSLHRGLLGIAIGDDDCGETKTCKRFIVLMEICQEGR